jgi:ABC-2 type transport system ATP-binding protein
MHGDVVLATLDLKKHFGMVKAVDGISLEVHRGEVFGFLGPNGAGKTTTIGMLLGLLHPTGGRLEIFGEPVTPAHTRALRHVGALLGTPGLYPYLSGRENLALVARLAPKLSRGRIDEVLAQVELTGAAGRKMSSYSTGMKQRLGLAAALLAEPELLILDEPTNGLDPAGMRDMRELVRRLADQGMTVFLSSHLLHEVEQVCDRVAVLNTGHVVAQGSVDQLLGGETIVRVAVPDPKAAAVLLQGLPGVKEIKANGRLEVSGLPSQTVVAYLASHGQVPSEVTTGREDLESVFLALTEGQVNNHEETAVVRGG